MPWDHPAHARAPASIKRTLAHARMFSTVMFGATLLYNTLLARVCELDTVEEYEADFIAWAEGRFEGAEFQPEEPERWDLEELRKVALHPAHRITPRAWEFIDRWVAFARGDRARLLSSPSAAALIREREWDLKGRRARLSEAEARSGWGGLSGYAPLNFRWNLVQRYLADFSA
jgi:hypothetical protein